MNNTIDLLQIKIEKAMRELPENTQDAIAAVDWKAAILGLRAKKGYTFEQLGDLELETELLLSGLLSPEDYPKELERRMRISQMEASELVNEMNDSVFVKIREELIKGTERKKIFINKKVIIKTEPVLSDIPKAPEKVLIEEKKETLPVPEKLELKGEVPSLLAQKLSGTVRQAPTVKTDHSIPNLSSVSTENIPVPIKPAIDPYREIPE